MYRILIVGPGYTGSRIAAYFHEKKQTVAVLSRGTGNRFDIPVGVQKIQGDLTESESLLNIPAAHFIVIAVAPDVRNPETYKKIYLDGIKNLLNAIKGNPKPFLIVYLSSTGVYGSCQEGWIDESILPKPDTEKGRILLEAEHQVLDSSNPSIVFRLAGIYGPDRNCISQMIEASSMKEGKNLFMNRFHVDDIVQAMPLLFNKAEAGNVYHGVDDQPVAKSEFILWLSQALNLPIDPRAPLLLENPAGKRLQNQKLKSLGFKLLYPSYKEGYQNLIDNFKKRAC